MKIPKQVLSKWKRLREKNDRVILAEKLNCSPMTVTRAFKGDATMETFNVIKEFYQQRKEELQSA